MGSWRDVISHVTIQIPMGHFLLVVHWTKVSISSRFWDIRHWAYRGHDLDLSGLRDVISQVTIRIPMGHFLLVVHRTQVSISTRFRDIWRYAYWGYDLDLSESRDVISHVTIRIPMGHFLLVVHWTKSLSQAVFEIFGPKYIEVTTSRPWPFWVTWRHQSRDHSNPNGPFPIGGP